MKSLLLLFVFLTSLFGDKILTIATYNVENLFDLEKKGYKYKEYEPNTKSNWNQKTYKIKLQNIARVIKDIDADIIALQEIHSLQALKDLRFTLKQNGLYYQYYSIADKKHTAIKVAILSKLPFTYSKELSVTSTYKYRNILETKLKIYGNDLYMFVNHWKAKSGPESMRITSAKSLRNRISEIGYDENIVLLGDFNSDYEEHIKFKKNRKLNDTNGKTGINHVLRTIKQNQKASNTKYEKENLYNLWYDTDAPNRYSYIFRGEKEALDNIIVSQPLLDKKGISYINDSITNLDKEYLFKKKQIYRWQVSKERVPKHKGAGYSDHLPVIAKFMLNTN
ncbi:Endonuclease/exonuclease/phosphatase [Sulfurimonas gotlandica GD1]|uniref:Endonuclease/exonuclease/phosphatase n=1 Tax=Sulfurimonas gotlandica (strain DSM 19862 / JCM 16533 / GD1) TaxID=929558 RepID=B6BKA2_SULGG|nr:endonuclease/exonuclease/phosphatase family protein [Sulfurimonas gotlandica]EDZ62240.1 endonuclease/exonuclease/phosphatase [Sulfurimonas gotlandica GD1]EHP28955.1 Endonuclease/exonuclease/phosphatase [Sulfurimonas gotlandica GD1]